MELKVKEMTDRELIGGLLVETGLMKVFEARGDQEGFLEAKNRYDQAAAELDRRNDHDPVVAGPRG